MNTESVEINPALRIVEDEFIRRKTINQSYSLRSYARNLGVSPGILSQVLNGKKDISPKVLSTIGEKLNLDQSTLDALLAKQSVLKKSKHIKNINKSNMTTIDMETFSIISDWYNFAILEIFNLDYYESTPEWISQKLGISVQDAKKGIENLIATKLVTRDEQGVLNCTNNFTAIDDYTFSSIAMRERQKQILKLSAEKIDSCNIAQRDHASITLTIDVELLPIVKEKIKDFRRTLANYIVKNSKSSNAVYEIQMSFIPLTQDNI